MFSFTHTRAARYSLIIGLVSPSLPFTQPELSEQLSDFFNIQSSSVAVSILFADELCVSANISEAAAECEDSLISVTSLGLSSLTEMDPSENIVTMATADRCAASLYNIFIKTNDVNSEPLIG